MKRRRVLLLRNRDNRVIRAVAVDVTADEAGARIEVIAVGEGAEVPRKGLAVVNRDPARRSQRRQRPERKTERQSQSGDRPERNRASRNRNEAIRNAGRLAVPSRSRLRKTISDWE